MRARVRVFTDQATGQLVCPRCVRVMEMREPRIAWQTVKQRDGSLVFACGGCVTFGDVRESIESGRYGW